MKKILLLAILIMGIFTLSACAKDEEAAYTNISNEELETMLLNKDDYNFIDVRTKTEYYEGHILGVTINIDFYLLEENHSNLDIFNFDKTKPVVIICNSGNRSSQASEIFYEEGFTEIYNLEFGIEGWTGEME